MKMSRLFGWAAALSMVAPAVFGGARPAEEPPAANRAHGADDAHAASEAHDSGHGPKYDLLTIDVPAAIWTIVIFLILLAMLRKFAFKPIQQTLIQRERFINDSLAKAKQEREEAERLLKQYTEQINKARVEASAIVAEGRRDAENVKHTIVEEAKKEAATTLERAKRELHIATETALQQLHHQTAHLATQIASRLIKKEVSADVHRDLIRESIEELGKARNN